MDCSDFERYLEIFLDGKLGGPRTRILGRHLVSCRRCRSRFDDLCSFERDLHRRFRSMRTADAVWASIEMEVCEGAGQSLRVQGALQTRPPPLASPAYLHEAKGHPLLRQVDSPQPAIPSRRKWIVAGLGVLGAAALARPAMWALGVTAPVDPYVEAYRAFIASGEVLEVNSDDPREVGDWLRARLGFDVPVPVLSAQTRLVGGLAGTVDRRRMAQIAYRTSHTTVLVFASPGRLEREAGPAEASGGSIRRVGWISNDLNFQVVAPLPLDRLEGFRP